MVRTAFGQLRTIAGVAVLCLALLAGVVGSTDTAEAMPRNSNSNAMMALCDATGGELTYRIGWAPDGSVGVVEVDCDWWWGSALCLTDIDRCFYSY